MLEFIMAGGFFMWGVLALGGVALGFNLATFFQTKPSFSHLILSLTLASFLLGLCGTGIGLYQAASLFDNVVSSQHSMLQMKVWSIAMTCTTMGAMLAAINLVLWGIRHHLEGPETV